MNPNAEFDLIVYGATGYTGRLVAEYLGQRYGVGGWSTMFRKSDTFYYGFAPPDTSSVGSRWSRPETKISRAKE